MEDRGVREPDVLLERAIVQVGLLAASHYAFILQACLLKTLYKNSEDNKRFSS